MAKNTAGLSLKWLLIVSFINNFGMGFVWPLTSVYLHSELHQSMVTIGWVLLANSAGQALGSAISGALFDKFKPINIIKFGVGMMILIQLGLFFYHGWPSYAIFLAFYGLMAGWMGGIINAYGTSVHHYDGRFVYNMLYFTANFGMVFATSLVGPIYSFGVQWLFVVALLMYTILFIIVYLNFNVPLERHVTEHSSSKMTLPRANAIMIGVVIVALIGIWIAYFQWNGSISVYMESVLKLPLWQYSMLWTINGGLVVIFQLIINALNLSMNTRAMWLELIIGMALFVGAFFSISFAKGFAGFVLAMVITTIAEVMVFPMLPALVNELTPAAVKGRYQGLVTAAPSMGRAIGPVVGGFMIDAHGYINMFRAMALLVAGVYVIFIGIALLVMRRTKRYV
ncbi:MFS transporter [Weissella soli]|uniref:MFS transporter n=1 Tax=Weissella soli TaxID=155866 RepID=UPI0035A160C8